MLRRQRAIEIVPSSKPLRWRRYDVPQHLAPETSDALRFCAVEGDLDLLDRRHRSTIEAGSFVVSTGPPLASTAVTLRDWGSWRVLQLAWAVASKLAQTGACATLEVYAANWLSGAIVASLPPDRPFTLHREVSLIAETELTPGFGHAVHTRGMMKVGRPDLIAGVPAAGSRKPDGSSATSPGCWPRATSSCQDSDCVSTGEEP